jgi:hypothetical protein
MRFLYALANHAPCIAVVHKQELLLFTEEKKLDVVQWGTRK